MTTTNPPGATAMPEHEWKLGDLAAVTCEFKRGERAEVAAVKVSGGWQQLDTGAFGRHGDIVSARPLLVIDPECTETALEPIWLALRDHHALRSRPELRFALRSLITPPKPEEPLGLGAVVLDVDGTRWVKWSTEARADRVWKHENEGGNYQTYANITAVKVLSEGVTQ